MKCSKGPFPILHEFSFTHVPQGQQTIYLFEKKLIITEPRIFFSEKDTEKEKNGSSQNHIFTLIKGPLALYITLLYVYIVK